MPSVDAATLLRVSRAVLEFGVVQSPAAVAKHLPLLACFKIGILWLLTLVIPERIIESPSLESVERFGILVLYANPGLPERVYREIRRLAIATEIPGLVLAIVLVDVPVVSLHGLPNHAFVELKWVGGAAGRGRGILSGNKENDSEMMKSVKIRFFRSKSIHSINYSASFSVILFCVTHLEQVILTRR